MLNKILYNNTLLKILSVLIAIALWAYIIIVIDAPTEKTFRDVPISTVNDNLLTENGYCIERLSVETASVKIEGSRKIISKFDSGNISAVLDFSDVNAAKLETEGVITVNLTVQSEFGEVQSYTPSAVDVYVETTKYKDIDVDVSVSGEAIDGYVVGDAELSQNKIRIFGAQKLIDQVSYAQVYFDLINVGYSAYTSGEISEDAEVKLYGENGEELGEVATKWIWNNTPTINITCPVYKIKTVTVNPITDGTVTVNELTCEPESIKIYGDADEIADISYIETETLTYDDFSESDTVNVKLLIPSGVKTVDDVTEVEVSEKDTD